MKAFSDYLVLVQNERTAGALYDHWEDVEGELYHFPNQYIGIIQEGKKFVYYRGVRRAGSKRGYARIFWLWNYR